MTSRTSVRADETTKDPSGERTATPGSLASEAVRPTRPDLLLLTDLYPPFVGGSAVLYENLYSRLADRTVVVLTDEVMSAGPDTRRGNVWIERRAIASACWGLIRFSALRHHWKVASHIKALADRKHTFVHCGRILPEGLAAWLARKRRGPRYACFAHGEDLTMQLNSSRELRMLTYRVAHGASAIFCNSNNTAGMVRDLGVRDERIRVIHPGVDPDEFRPGIDGSAFRQRYAPDGEPFMLSIGRLEPRKGFDLTIRAIAKLRERIPKVRYLIVGGGQDSDRLASLVRDLKVEENVFMTGKVPGGDLPRYYAACDVFVHPNRIEGVDLEGFGIVFLEAAATERVTIGGDSGGVPEAIAQNKTGLLVSGTDVNELASAMERLITSPQLREEMGKRGRQRVLEGFTWDAAAAKMAAALHEVS